MSAHALELSRRQFLQVAAAATVTPRIAAAATAAVTRARPAASALIDTNVALGAWPFRRHALTDTTALVAKLEAQGVTEAWAGSFDALLHKDIASVNARLAADCEKYGPGRLKPFGAVNPMIPGWEEEVRRCAVVYRMPGIRLHPNYHGYKLAAPIFARLLVRATELGLLVQIAVIMEDERTIHPLVNVPATDVTPLVALMREHPSARVQLLNAFRTLRGPPLIALANARVRFEIATLEGAEGIMNLLPQLAPDCLAFGSYAPVFYPESALLKLQESILTPAQAESVRVRTAQTLMQRT